MLRLGFLFVTMTTLEIYLLWTIGGALGVPYTIGLILFTGFLGAYLTKLQGLRILRDISETLQRGEMPTTEIISGVSLIAVGAFLMTPGFLTDTIGFLLLVPAIRNQLIKVIQRRLEKWIAKNTVMMYQTTSFSSSGESPFGSYSVDVEPPVTIDVEIKK